MKTGKKTGRIPELDGLRVLMILIVSWFHIWQQSWLEPSFEIGESWISLDFLVRSGYVWVDGTILLSAFLLYLPLARKRNSMPADALPGKRGTATPADTLHQGSGDPFPIRDFYLRKARRLLPAYWFIILAFFLGICLPWGLYQGNGPYMVKDLFTHFTLIFPYWRDTYIYTPLGAASWTLSVVAQGYLLFPLIAKCIRKHPAATLLCMAGSAMAFRAWCVWGLTDYSMVVNTFVNFLDIYALGFGCAMLYVRFEQRAGAGAPKTGRAGQGTAPGGTQPAGDPKPGSPGQGTAPNGAQPEQSRKRRLLCQAAATVIFIGSVIGALELQRVQSATPGHPELQRMQMLLRPAFALCFAGMILSAPFSLKPLRFLLGNRVTAFLAGISMNYYLTHQTLAVHMRRIGFPASVSDSPNMAGEQPWQTQYTLLAFGIPLIVSILITYLIEKPAARFLEKRTGRRSSASAARKEQ